MPKYSFPFAKLVTSLFDILTSSDKARKKVEEMNNCNRTNLEKKEKIGIISCSYLVVRPYFESTILTEIFPSLTWIKWENETGQGFVGA